VLRWNERAEPVHAAMLDFHRELLALRARVLVPRLRDGAHGEGYEVIAPTAVRVTWRLGDGSHLELLANLGASAVTAAGTVAGAPIFGLGDVPARGEGMLGPWSVGWFLDS
jgi:maltooligosyltrehalose trehalohydrolase